MTAPQQYKPKETQFSKNGNKPADKAGQLLDYAFNPSFDQLTGLTRVALDKVLPNSAMRVFAEETIRLCRLAKDSQELYTNNWALWHSEKEFIPGVGKRLRHRDFDEVKWRKELERGRNILNEPDVDSEKNPISFELPNSGVNQEIVDTKKDPRFKLPILSDMIGVRFLYQYHLNRRSTVPDMLLEFFGLMGRTIEVGKDEDEGNPKMRIPQ